MPHALLSASGAARWIACPPSARLEESLPETTSAFAEEGTFAHELSRVELERHLLRVPAGEYLDAWKVLQGNRLYTDALCADVLTYVNFAISRIAAARKVSRDAVILLEQRVDYSHIAEDGFGTCDLILIAEGNMEVIDLKFGKGVRVSAEENAQLMLYGLGALNRFGWLYDVASVRLTIHQPRLAEEPSSWDTTQEYLLAWAEKIAPRAALAWAGEGEFNPGDACGFCKAKGTCRARAEANLTMAQDEFKLPGIMTDEDISRVLPKLDGLIKWAQDVKAHALKTACAGRKFSGWKLVRGPSNRRYKDPARAAQVLRDAGFDDAVIYQPPVERALLGIPAMERLLTKRKFTELLGGFIEKPTGNLTLVQANDKRPEVEALGTEGFEDLEETEA